MIRIFRCFCDTVVFVFFAVIVFIDISITSCLQPAYGSGGRDFEKDLPDQIHFKNFSTKDGLSVNSVVSITQDDDGFMWFGTINGLNRYDGYDFSIFGYDPSNPLRNIGKNNIYSLLAAKDDIWIGCEYLVRYNRKQDRLKQYPVTNNMGIRAITSDDEGMLWFGGVRLGIRKFNPATETVEESYFQSSGDTRQHSDSINDILIDPTDKTRIWLAGARGLFLLDRIEKKILSPFDHPVLNRSNISSLAMDGAGRLWIGTWDGLYRYDISNHRVERIPVDPGSDQAIQYHEIHSLLTDSSGNIWIGTDKHGVAVYEAAHNRFKQYPAGIDDPYSIGKGAVFDIFEDREQGIWFGTKGFGAYRFDPDNQMFQYFPPRPENQEMLNFPQILSMVEGDNFDIWVATDGGGLNRHIRGADRRGRRFVHYRHDPDDEASLSSDSVIALAKEDDGDLWIGTWAGGLNKLDPSTGRFKRWKMRRDDENEQKHQINHGDKSNKSNKAVKSENPDRMSPVDQAEKAGLASDNIFKLYIDSNAQLWISVWGEGVQTFDLETETFSRVHRGNPSGNKHAMRNNNVMAILEDKDKIMWLGGFNGLDRYDPSTGKWYNYNADDASPHVSTITSNTLFVIHQSEDGSLWIGTDNGLNHFNPETETFSAYTKADGLPNNSVLGILEDNVGNLWLSTRYGLARFNPETGQCRNYFEDMGLQSNEFNRFAYAKLKSGEMVFGGGNGYNLFHPGAADHHQNPPQVVLTDLLLFNRRVNVGEGQRLSAVVNQVSQIVLKPEDDTVSLTFSALEYSTPAGIRYRYRMEALDADWICTDPLHRIATYTYLGPGHYSFLVQAKYENSDWGEGKKVDFLVLPCWWETIWFRILMGGLVLPVLYGIYLIRLHRLRLAWKAEQHVKEAVFYKERNKALGRMNRELEALALEKEELLHLVAHDLRNPLNGIKSGVQVLPLIVGSETEQEVNEVSDRILSMISRMLEMINKLLKEKDGEKKSTSPSFSSSSFFSLSTVPPSSTSPTESNEKKDRLIIHEEVQKSVFQHQPAAERKDIVIHLSSDLSREIGIFANRTAFHRILDNLISNSIKFSYPKSEISVQCRLNGGDVLIAVRDQGQGLSESDQDMLFGKRVQLSARPTAGEISSGIGLFSAKKLVEEMGGTIFGHSRGVGKGCTFEVRFPFK